METVVVIVLITVLSTMAISSLSGSTAAAGLRTAARQLQLTAQAARAYAAVHGTTTRLVLDAGQGRFLVEKEIADRPGQFEPMNDGVHKPVTLQGLKLVVLDLDIDLEALGEPAITFHPGGDATAAIVEIGDGRRSFTLRVDGATGRVVLTEGRITERLSERIDLDV